jgi:phosphohistidine phosphatase
MQEHKLLLMRHAKSVESAESGKDFDRSLAPQGAEATKTIGKWLKKNSYRPDRVICSPALRTKQTCQLLLEVLGIAEHDVIWVTEVYNASLNDLLFIVDKHGKGVCTLLIIGHNPGLDQLLCYLSKDPPPVNVSGKLLTTAALAIFDYGSEAISTKTRNERLQSLIRPKEIGDDA